MNVTPLKALVALVPTSMLLSGSVVLFLKGKTVSSFLLAQDVWCWSFLPMCPKHFAYFPRCVGDLGIALGITSILGVLLLDSRCFQWDIFFMHLHSKLPNENARNH